jgi:hypothetical protein
MNKELDIEKTIHDFIKKAISDPTVVDIAITTKNKE